MASYGEQVYCTLLMSDAYLPGAAVLAHSLRDGGTTKKLAVLVTLDTLSADTVTELKALYDYLIPVERIRTPNPSNLFLMDRADLAFAFTKIALWRQVQFSKIVYIDADVVALRAPDELFNIDAPFAAAPDVGWPDAFNTGVMVLTPNMGDYWALQTLAASGDSFDGADQGLLNQYYEHKNWHRLSFTYNCTPNAQYQWEPAYRHYKSNIKMVHFIGKDKPWTKGRQSPGGVYNELLGRWWAVYDKHLKGQSVKSVDFGTTSIEHLISTPQIIEPEAPTTSTELPLSDPGETVENIDQGYVEPTPTVDQRKFSAPIMSWDATRSEPPSESKPEAANFPSQTYEWTESRSLFQAPQSYPEPPKDMWYQVPETKPTVADKPKPIFPWEKERSVPKPTRVFAEDLPPAPIPTVSASAASKLEEKGPESSTSPPQTAEEGWQAFSQSSNAWDSVPGIESYVRAIMEAQTRHGRPSPGIETLGPAGGPSILSPTLSRQERRESLILTDFPTAVERPSLPVTPAPIRRPTFWGDERDEAGELPAAEGVPDQVDWVCPQCGFSSTSAASFRRVHHRLSSSASASTAPTLAPTVQSPQTVTAPPVKISPFSGVSSRGAPLASLTPSYFPSPGTVNALAKSHGLTLQSESDVDAVVALLTGTKR
ncbi:nucleotide-diphospho-sugar transferase [Mytilinidion resinicola]|uniref:glycogenin glucosyltransferase n=1 Tax=Mytilinidion resinicola TaxID=574789 RepID=A0A6A6ZAL3_9PEZI|nr:nucleotide-diphospho-sugar transferase [Mytilinidion resinicola]KAF2817335.1 nucleotide-diphospho-sugar transferase [Mytilinidion resinicola]